MATTDEGQQEQSKRDRAFLGQLPDDFLRVEEAPRSEQRTNSHQRYFKTASILIIVIIILVLSLLLARDHPHLVPMTYSPQQLGYRHGEGTHVGKLKVTILQVK